ncbi:MAG: ABC transporter ATP-binding protein [Chloroflexi bacterium]|nr:ABC transporter ATP-binding protein [Chloroflexota bacterium]
MSDSQPAIQTFELRKVYDGGKVAVEGLTLTVGRGEVFGYLGPNGAGKTTSIKMMLGLVGPTAGSASILGEPIGTTRSRKRVGFLPEHFRFHEWMRADEFLDLHGQLYGMSKADRKARIPGLIEQVGLAESAQKRLSTFSKGMLQRIGLAMSLLHRPALVFLDEPTSGLDPFGRLLVRDVIRAARAEGTTVFLNSHLLSEVEVTCDRVAFIRRGQVVRSGSIDELAGGVVRVKLKLGQITPNLLNDLSDWGERIEQTDEREVSMMLSDEDRLPDMNAWLVGQGVRVYAIAQQPLSLEELFVTIMKDDQAHGNGARPSEPILEEQTL